jgi:hypothetical protein
VRDVFFHADPARWEQDKGQWVVYYPLLVVMEEEDRGECVWLPYWHLVTDKKTCDAGLEAILRNRHTKRPFGQWAPFMYNAAPAYFQDLLEQAVAKGYLAELGGRSGRSTIHRSRSTE